MKSKRLLFRLLPTYLAIILLVGIILTWFTMRGLDQFNHAQAAEHLLASTNLVREVINREQSGVPDYEKLSYELSGSTGIRITIIDREGRVLGDSDSDAELMERHADRPEFIEAVNGRNGRAVRYSQTLLSDMLYVAVPVWENGYVKLVVRSAVPLRSLHTALRPVFSRMIVATFFLVLFSLVVSLFVTRRITRPLEAIRAAAEQIARGEFHNTIAHFSVSELDSLANSMNQMARELQQRVSTITKQRNEQQAVLAGMVEGVLAIDSDEKIIRINQAAARLFECSPTTATGQLVPETVRHTGLQEFIRQLLADQSHQEKDFLMLGLEERYIRASGAPLFDSGGNCFGVVVVLNDITRLKKLENLRQEFVGNVAHELKTPLTAIKGFVETLQGGALDNPNDARHFLEIIGRQADRLNAILEDLLRLSKIEQQREHSEIALEPVRLRDILAGSVRDCEVTATAKSIAIKLDCQPGLMIQADPILFRQAITNLIDNAIKYSESNTKVQVTAKQTAANILIAVSDQGIGIADQHIPRLFERFYRVDKGRSRKAGGTGLGLAIVKHIVLAHNGTITVSSSVDQGSTFSIELPAVVA